MSGFGVVIQPNPSKSKSADSHVRESLNVSRDTNTPENNPSLQHRVGN